MRFHPVLSLTLVLMASGLITARQADAALLTHHGIYPDVNPSNAQLDLSVVNDNDGAIYNSGQLNVTRQLAIGLWNLSANSNSADPLWNGYTTMDEMIADWNVAISGEVQNGWNGTPNSDGSFSMNNIGGIPNTSYDEWTSDPSQDMQFYTINIPKSQLEFDGIAGYDPNSDATIVLSGAGNTIPDAFVAYEGSIGQYQAEGQYFQVAVPEASTSALVMGVLSGGLLFFRRRRLSERY